MGRIRDVIRGREENWHSQELLVLSSQPSMYSFFKRLFGSNFKLPDTSTRAVERTSVEPLPRFAFGQTLAPPALSFAFFHGHFFRRMLTLGTYMLTHTQDTHSHSDTHTYRPLLGFCVVFHLKTKTYQRVGGSRWNANKGGALLLSDGPTAPLPPPCHQGRQLVFGGPGLGMNHSMDRDQKKYLIRKKKAGYFFL